jgi:UDP-N-acetylmuramoyl-tripeptide--D-alanyl-D-alanine ligase
MIKFLAHEIAAIMGGTYKGEANLEVSGEFIFDSRLANEGSVFIALKGEARDGHEFVPAALENGAVLSIVTKDVLGNHIIVSDVLVAIAKFAHQLREELTQLKVIAITGSQGKTTTKDMLNSILSAQGETIAPVGSYNNDIGVPITLLRCTKTTKYVILEMGARHEGDIARLTELAAPDVGVVLKVGSAHLGEFGSREGIARTKGELIRGLKSSAVAVLGTYDEFTPKMADALPNRKILFGETSSCTVRAADIEMHGGFPSFDLVTPTGRERVELQILGMHQISNALAAAAAAVALGISTTEIASALSMHQNASKWRMELLELEGLTLINDSYNANPESMAAALRTLTLLTQERGGNSWAFLGKMHELGVDSPKLHREIGELARELRIDHLVAIGESEFITGLSGGITTHFFANPEEASAILNQLAAGDVVLVKASRAEHLELIAEKIKSYWSAQAEGERS